MDKPLKFNLAPGTAEFDYCDTVPIAVDKNSKGKPFTINLKSVLYSPD